MFLLISFAAVVLCVWLAGASRRSIIQMGKNLSVFASPNSGNAKR